MSTANLITLFRILALPLVISLYFEFRTFAVIVFLLAVFSDIIDGYIARKKHQTTKIGSFLDPFADKVLIFGLLTYFLILGVFPLFVLVIFILRDLICGIVRILASRDDIYIIGKKTYSQTLTYLQYLVVLLILMNFSVVFIYLAIGVALLIVFFSIIQYFLVYLSELRERKKRGRKLARENMIILVNRLSRGYKQKYRRRILRLFARKRKATIYYLNRSKDIFAGIDDRIKDVNHIILAGGDGTFEAALSSAKFKDKSLGFFPLGAGNAFYAYFYKGKRFEYLRSRFPFIEDDLDIVEVKYNNKRKLTTFLSIGIDAEVMRLSKQRTKNGFLDYVKGSLAAWKESSAQYNFLINVDGKEHSLKNCSVITLGKIPYLGFAIRAMPGKVVQDDEKVYGCAVVNTHSSFLNKPVRLWALLFGMVNIKRSPFVSFKGQKIKISSEIPFALQTGGDFLDHTKSIELIVKKKQKVLMI